MGSARLGTPEPGGTLGSGVWAAGSGWDSEAERSFCICVCVCVCVKIKVKFTQYAGHDLKACGSVVAVCVCSALQSCSILRPCGLQCSRLPCPWDSPGKNTGAGCYFLFHGIFLTQGLNMYVFCISCIGRRVLYHCTTWEALWKLVHS